MLPSVADLVECQARKRAKQGKASRKREKQRQHVIAEGQPRDKKADDRVYDAQEQDMTWFPSEILPALGQGIIQVGKG